MADALQAQDAAEDLPAALPYPLSIHVRNSDLNIDESGNASRLDETRLLATLRTQVNPGTVFFTSIDMRSINSTARGLIRVLSQRPLEGAIGVETLAEFIELSDDARSKIQRLRGGGNIPVMAPPARNFVTDQIGVQPVYQRSAGRQDFQVTSSERTYFEPAPLRQQAKPTNTTKFFGSLGVTAYVLVALAIIAMFPAGRGVELLIWGKIAWFGDRIWYWANHVGDVKLYNNS